MNIHILKINKTISAHQAKDKDDKTIKYLKKNKPVYRYRAK